MSETEGDNPAKEPTIVQLEDFTDEQFQTQIRLNRKVFDYIKDLLKTNLSKHINETEVATSEGVPTDKQLFTALYFLANGKYQCPRESNGNTSEPESFANQCLSNVTNCLLEIAPQFIKFPTPQEISGVQQKFCDIGGREHGFSTVLGVIDCTQIRLQAPTNNSDVYVNRNSHHSINVQIVCGPDLEIYNVLAAFPGGYRDSYIWKNSNLRHVLADSGVVNGWLIGDLGYPQEPWLMTPIVNPKSPDEELYNKVHSATWKPIENCVEVLKSRFGCLQTVLDYTPEIVCAITTACCVLHNICLQHGDMKIISELKEKENTEGSDLEQITMPVAMEEGVDARDALIKSNFCF